MNRMCPISFIFLGQLLVMVPSGSCVTAPPYTAGMLLPFTACVTERKNTVTVIESNHYVSGEYTDIPWGK